MRHKIRYSKRVLEHGLKHEIVKRFPLSDWYKSRPVSNLMDLENSDDVIFNCIEKGLPALVGRLGGTEARFISSFLKKCSGSTAVRQRITKDRREREFYKRRIEVQKNAGFYFDDHNDASRFVELYIECLESTEILGAWGYAFTWPEVFALQNSALKVINKEFTAPWVEIHNNTKNTNIGHPFSSIFENKKILVVSPFAQSIDNQHKNINTVFSKIYYPKFSLQIIAAPLTSGILDSKGQTWFEHLAFVKNQIDHADFDIALLSCGSYSYPLALHVKKLGKIGIHSGGALQLFFGIMGKRWESSPHILKYFNQYWVRPMKEETPNGSNLIEGGCYW